MKVLLKINLPLLAIFLIIGQSTSYGQNGYFGYLNDIDFSITANPSLRTRGLVTDGETKGHYSGFYRIANFNYKLTYNHITTKKKSIGIGLIHSNTFDKATSFKYFSTGYNPKIKTLRIESYRMPYNAITANIKFFRSGCISPVGKFLGIQVDLGRSKLVIDKVVGIGGYDDLYKYIIYDARDQKITANYLFIKGIIGRNVVLGKHFTLSTEMVFNVLGLAFNTSYINFTFEDFFYYAEEILSFGYLPDHSKFVLYDRSMSKSRANFNTITNTIFSYNRMTFNLGLKYHF